MAYVALAKPETGTAILSGTLVATTTGGTGAGAVSFVFKVWEGDFDAFTRLEESTGDGDDQYISAIENAGNSYMNWSITGALQPESDDAFNLALLHTQSSDAPKTLGVNLANGLLVGAYKVMLERVRIRYNYRRAMIACSLSGKVHDQVLTTPT